MNHRNNELSPLSSKQVRDLWRSLVNKTRDASQTGVSTSVILEGGTFLR